MKKAGGRLFFCMILAKNRYPLCANAAPSGPDHGLLPHPVMAPVAFPAGQPAFAELQIEPIFLVEKPAAADVAEREKNLVARAAVDVIQRHAERGGCLLRVHAEKQRRVVR